MQKKEPLHFIFVAALVFQSSEARSSEVILEGHPNLSRRMKKFMRFDDFRTDGARTARAVQSHSLLFR
jgi:hypothetical protein